MKKNIMTIVLLVIVFMGFSCGGKKEMFRSPAPGFGFTNKTQEVDENSLEYKMEMALMISDDEECYKRVEELLKQGANPNKMHGRIKWVDTNPLWLCCRNTRFAKLFISYGADVTKRPYIYKCVMGKIALTDEEYTKWKEEGYAAVKSEKDTIEILNVLLESGADPNMKGIFGEKVLLIPTDWNYRRYFNKHGKLPINQAIKYNSIKIATLLLDYGAILDEQSLQLAKETTERTGSAEMEELVKKQWEIQNKK